MTHTFFMFVWKVPTKLSSYEWYKPDDDLFSSQQIKMHLSPIKCISVKGRKILIFCFDETLPFHWQWRQHDVKSSSEYDTGDQRHPSWTYRRTSVIKYILWKHLNKRSRKMACVKCLSHFCRCYCLFLLLLFRTFKLWTVNVRWNKARSVRAICEIYQHSCYDLRPPMTELRRFFQWSCALNCRYKQHGGTCANALLDQGVLHCHSRTQFIYLVLWSCEHFTEIRTTYRKLKHNR